MRLQEYGLLATDSFIRVFFQFAKGFTEKILITAMIVSVRDQ